MSTTKYIDRLININSGPQSKPANFNFVFNNLLTYKQVFIKLQIYSVGFLQHTILIVFF